MASDANYFFWAPTQKQPSQLRQRFIDWGHESYDYDCDTMKIAEQCGERQSYQGDQWSDKQKEQLRAPGS